MAFCDFTDDFITGFDKGIKHVQTHPDNIYDSFPECPVLQLKTNGPFSQLQQVFKAGKSMMSLTKDKNVDTILKTLEVYMN